MGILIVDDDPRVRKMLIRYFEQEGYRTSGAADGAAMRAQLAAKSVDIILLDIIMPGEDGPRPRRPSARMSAAGSHTEIAAASSLGRVGSARELSRSIRCSAYARLV